MPDGEETRRSLLDPSTLQTLIQQLEQTDIDELELVAGASRVYIRREPGKRAVMQHLAAESATIPGIPVVAPLTGIFYSRATPADPPYASEGDVVEAGQVVALIETMKIFNEIKTEVSGEVVEMSVRDGDLVETGATIMIVLPRTGGEA